MGRLSRRGHHGLPGDRDRSDAQCDPRHTSGSSAASARVRLAGLVGVDLEDSTRAPRSRRNGVEVIGASHPAAQLAFASYAPLRALFAVGVVRLSQRWCCCRRHGRARIHVGFRSGGGDDRCSLPRVRSRIRVPPLVLVVPAVVPLLPGLMIYRGLALLADGRDGVPQLVAAAARRLPRFRSHPGAVPRSADPQGGAVAGAQTRRTAAGRSCLSRIRRSR